MPALFTEDTLHEEQYDAYAATVSTQPYPFAISPVDKQDHVTTDNKLLAAGYHEVQWSFTPGAFKLWTRNSFPVVAGMYTAAIILYPNVAVECLGKSISLEYVHSRQLVVFFSVCTTVEIKQVSTCSTNNALHALFHPTHDGYEGRQIIYWLKKDKRIVCRNCYFEQYMQVDDDLPPHAIHIPAPPILCPLPKVHPLPPPAPEHV